jgi:hypothetical protein
LPLLNRKPDLKSQYSKSDPECAENLKIIEDDLNFEAELQAAIDRAPTEESDESVLAAIDAFDDLPPAEEAAIELANTKAAALAAAVRELVRAHGPFDSWQIDQIMRTLNTPADGPAR